MRAADPEAALRELIAAVEADKWLGRRQIETTKL
jgi:hypothetical protein